MVNHHKKHWDWHPHVRTGDQLSLGERAADILRSGMGSWPFIFIFLSFMGFWMLFLGVVDPFPYILLNLMLSTLAGLQGGIILIASKRQDNVNAELAKADRAILHEIRDKVKEINNGTSA